jgi:hypothetical protein
MSCYFLRLLGLQKPSEFNSGLAWFGNQKFGLSLVEPLTNGFNMLWTRKEHAHWKILID